VDGIGGFAGDLTPSAWSQNWNLGTLADKIDADMPSTNVGACVGACAVNTAAYILTLQDPPDPVAGKAAYDAQCAACHGADGVGGAFGDLTPNVWTQAWDQDSLTTKIEDTMPLGQDANCVGDCARNTAAYILTLETPPDPIAGKLEYDAQCAACHGPDGVGGAFGDLTPNAWTQTWDQASLTTKIEDTMPLGQDANCVGDCAKNTAAYILTLEEPSTPGDAAAGEAFYAGASCGGCHGADRTGGFGPDITGSAMQAKYGSDFAGLVSAIQGMSAFGASTTTEEAENLAAYLLTD
jgi:mono/diheme cytochrome c family protein